MNAQPRNYTRAATYALTAFGGWTISDALLKLVREAGVPQGQMLLISGISGVATIFLFCLLRGNLRRLQPRQAKGLVAIGLCQWIAFICWVTALPHLPLVNMYAVSFMTPMTVATLAWLILKEHLGWKRAVAIGIGFAGVVISLDPAKLLGGDARWLSYLTVCGSMLGTACQMLLLRAAGPRESSECTAFYPRMVLVGAGMLSCAATGFTAMQPWVVIALCGSGLLGSLGWTLMARAYKNAPAAAVAPFHYSQLIGGTILGYLIWHNVPDAYLMSGAAIIVASGIYLVRHERRVSRMMVRTEET